MIELRTMHAIVVERDGEPLVLQPKRLLLLVYLILEGRDAPVRREQLLALFWPEATAEQARNALRQALFGLRTVLGADVIVARGSTELVIDAAAVRCDAVALLHAVERADHAAVASLATGEFLAGIAADVGAELERWVEDARTRFRRLAAMSIRALADRESLPLAERRTHLERLLLLTPYDESAAMQLFGVLVSLNERAVAVETYRRFAQRLEADLEIRPSEAFVRLVDSARVSEGTPWIAPVGPTTTPTIPTASTSAPVPPTAWAGRRGVVFVIAGVVLLLTGWLSLRPKPDPTLVDVRPFTTAASDSEARQITRTAAGRLRGALVLVPGFRVIGESDSAMVRPAALQRAGTVIEGGVDRIDAGRWRVWATVTAAESGMLLQRVQAEGAAQDTVWSEFTDKVTALVGTRRDMVLHWGESLHRPMSLQALELYQSAFEAVATRDADGGIALFEQAWGVDSTFVFAGIMAATNAEAVARYAHADSLLTALKPFEGRLLPLERMQLRRVKAFAKSDVRAGLAESRAIAALEPRAPFLIAQYAEDAYISNRPREALDALARLPKDMAEEVTNQVTIRASSLHLLGRFAEELRVVNAVIEQQPPLSHFVVFRLPPLAALGQIDTLGVMLGAMANQDDGRDMGRLYRAAGLELLAHGFPADGERMLETGVEWLGHQTPLPRPGAARRQAAAELLFDAGRTEEAWTVASQLSRELGDSLTPPQRSALRGLQGLIAARKGQRALAMQFADSLARNSGAGRGHFGVETYRRARIAAVMGDDERAIALLEQAMQEGFVAHREIHFDANFARLRSDPDFERVTRPRG